MYPRPFLATRLCGIACALLLTGSLVALLLPRFAILGSHGLAWGLLNDCPLCIEPAGWVEPIQKQLSSATRITEVIVWAALVLGLSALARFAACQGQVDSTEILMVGLGAFCLSVSPVCFVFLVPQTSPVHLDVAGYGALAFGVVSLVMSTAAARAVTQSNDSSMEESWILAAAADDDDLEKMAASEVAAYGTLSRLGE